MDDDDDSDSEVEYSRKRKLNILEDEDSDETDDEDDDEDSDSEGDEETEESDDEVEDNPGDDVNLADDVNNDQCAICLMEFTDQKVGVPNNCAHVFCLVCIQEWAKNINTCPVDRKVFQTVTVRHANNAGVIIEEIKVEDRTQLKDEYEDPTTCEVCGIGDREDSMLLCDGCDRGFHLECLTPPLDNVPEEEWFCHDCFLDTAQQDTIDYSQHDIQFSDDDSPTVEAQSRSIVGSSIGLSSQASTSQQRRARTVATSRTQQTRRRRRRRQPSRSAGKRSKKTTRKTTKKTKSSNKDPSTSKTSGTKAKRKRRRKKVRKSRRKKRKIESDGVSQSNTRYMLPREMESTATFSLFGSDFDLEYLPVIESPSGVVTSTQTSSPRSSTGSNPDVLGSIFTGLNTLHSDSLSVDNKGRVRRDEKKSTSQLKSTKVSITGKQTVSTSNKEKKPSLSLGNSSTYSSQRMLGPCVVHADNENKQPIDTSTVNRENERSRQFINEKRIKRFDTSASTVTRPKTDCTPLMKVMNVYPKSDLTSTFTSSNSTPDVPKSELGCKEKLITSTVTYGDSTLNVPKTELRRKEKLTTSTASANSAVDLSKSELTAKERLTTSTSGNLTRYISQPRTQGICLDLSKAELRAKEKITTLSSSKLDLSKTEQRAAAQPSLGSYKIPRKKPSTSSLARANHKRTENLNLKQGAKPTRSRIVRFNIPDVPKQSTGILHLLPQKTGMSPLRKVGVQGKTKRELLNKTSTTKPSVVTTPNVEAKPSRDSTQTSERSTTYIEPARPIAVVHPTKVDGNGTLGISHDTEAARKRREGIERLQRKQAICEEVKKALKPFYKNKEISKENYKDIYGWAVEKINKSSHPVVSRGVEVLVKTYVKKLKGRQMQSKTTE